MRQPADIAAALKAFDGTHVVPLKSMLNEDLSPDAEAALIAAIPGPYEVPATWLVKALVERHRLGQGTLATLFDRLPKVTRDAAALHLLQCAQHAPDVAKLLRPHLNRFFEAKKILLRVWAFDAYCRGAEMPAERGDLTERLRQGLTDRSAAMRARSRALAAGFDIDLDQRDLENGD